MSQSIKERIGTINYNIFTSRELKHKIQVFKNALIGKAIHSLTKSEAFDLCYDLDLLSFGTDKAIEDYASSIKEAVNEKQEYEYEHRSELRPILDEYKEYIPTIKEEIQIEIKEPEPEPEQKKRRKCLFDIVVEYDDDDDDTEYKININNIIETDTMPSKKELYVKAKKIKDKNCPGISKMSKTELKKFISKTPKKSVTFKEVKKPIEIMKKPIKIKIMKKKGFKIKIKNKDPTIQRELIKKMKKLQLVNTAPFKRFKQASLTQSPVGRMTFTSPPTQQMTPKKLQLVNTPPFKRFKQVSLTQSPVGRMTFTSPPTQQMTPKKEVENIESNKPGYQIFEFDGVQYEARDLLQFNKSVKGKLSKIKKLEREINDLESNQELDRLQNELETFKEELADALDEDEDDIDEEEVKEFEIAIKEVKADINVITKNNKIKITDIKKEIKEHMKNIKPFRI